MVKQFIPAFLILVFLSSCSSFKPLNFTSNKQVNTPAATSRIPTSSSKFIDDISITPEATQKPAVIRTEQTSRASNTRSIEMTAAPRPKAENDELSKILAARNTSSVSAIEAASSVQLKYAVLMNTEVESLPSKQLLEVVDEWYGVRYRTGGNTTSGVDCSGFTVAVYAALYGMTIPRVSREQYRISRKISTTELQEGDLVFFNTNGRGVSHVGVYLGNNKFIHASVSRGVMVNDLFESYYLKRYIGAGRIDDKEMVADLSKN